MGQRPGEFPGGESIVMAKRPIHKDLPWRRAPQLAAPAGTEGGGGASGLERRAAGKLHTDTRTRTIYICAGARVSHRPEPSMVEGVQAGCELFDESGGS